MDEMFSNCKQFNKDISNWDIRFYIWERPL